MYTRKFTTKDHIYYNLQIIFSIHFSIVEQIKQNRIKFLFNYLLIFVILLNFYVFITFGWIE